MAFYATSMLPLCRKPDGVKTIFYADDGGGGGKLDGLRTWWDTLNEDGPALGYFPNPGKTWVEQSRRISTEHQHCFRM